MKITGTRTQIVELPADEPLANAPENPNGKRPIVTLRVETDSGAEGIGVAYFGGALTRTLAAIDGLAELVIGENPMRVEAIQAKLAAAGRLPGRGGILPWPCRHSTSRCGTSGQGAGAAAVEDARRRARACPGLCQRRAEARAARSTRWSRSGASWTRRAAAR